VPLARLSDDPVQERVHLLPVVTAEASSELDANDIGAHRPGTAVQHLRETLEVSVDSSGVVTLHLLIELDPSDVSASHLEGLPLLQPECAVTAANRAHVSSGSAMRSGLLLDEEHQAFGHHTVLRHRLRRGVALHCAHEAIQICHVH